MVTLTADKLPAVDFSQAEELGNGLLARVNELRDARSISWNDSVHGWVVTGFDEVNDGFLAKVPLSCVRLHTSFAHISPEDQERYFPRVLRTIVTFVLNSDPPRHTRLRLLMMPAFSRKVAEEMRPFVRDTVRTVLDRAGAKGRVEFIDEVARSVTGQIITRLLGIPERFLERLEEWAYNIDTAFGTPMVSIETMVKLENTIIEMEEVFSEQLEIRRKNPTGDFMSQLLLARDGEDRLSTEEIFGVLLVALIAGHDTTMNTMGLSVVALAEQPEAREQLLNGEGDLTSKLMELMRYVAMSSAMARTAATDFEWQGNQIKAGDTVILMIAAANRDPNRFGNPEQIDFDHNPTNKILSFGGGRHHCIGHYLAKMQLEEFFPELFRRFDVDILDRPLSWRPGFWMRGLRSLNVALIQKN